MLGDSLAAACGSSEAGAGTRIETVRPSPNWLGCDSPKPSRSTLARTRSICGACGNCASTIRPPTKSTPRLRPWNQTMKTASRVSSPVVPNAQWRSETKPILVSSGMSLSRRISSASDMDFGGPRAAHPLGDQHAGEDNRCEHRGDDADQEHDRKALDRPGAHQKHDRTGDDVDHVRFEDGTARFLIAVFDRHDHGAALSSLFPYALVDQHVRVHGGAHGQHEAGNARQRQGAVH